MAIPLIGMAIFFGWQWLNDGITPKEAASETKQAVQAQVTPPKPPPPVPTEREKQPSDPPRGSEAPRGKTRPRTEARTSTPELTGRGGDIVLIIDDLGFEGQPLEDVMALDPNVNCAILPNGTSATDFAERLNAAGYEVLCHLPMQPRGRQRPGRNAILTSMSDEEIDQLTRQNIEAVPYARGVNNHMGSLATSDRRVMERVLRAMPDGLYFIDSRTGGRSIAADVARELNIRTATRHVFLDDLATEHAVRRQLAELAAAAEKHGVAIGIGHPYGVTMRVLRDELPRLRERGFRLVRASEVVR